MFTYPKADFAEDYDPTSRPWYKLAAETPDQVVWTEPYKDVVTGDMIVTLYLVSLQMYALIPH